jgi:sialate O-acetylesterase
MNQRILISVLGLSTLLWTEQIPADVKLPAVFSDHMVLQQQIPLRIWGWADAGEMVTVTIGPNTEMVKTPENGRWEVKLPAMTASKTSTSIKVQGKNTIAINDVLVGEVWLCSGQSNMEWPVAASVNANEEISAAKYPMIRHIKVPLVPSTVPLDNFQSAWQVCSPETAGGFTACGYFMARKLQKELDVPVGLINSSWGGTRIEPWTPPVGFQRVDALQSIYQSVVGRTPGTPEYRSRLESHVKAIEAWTAKANAALKDSLSSSVEPSPTYPAELTPFTSNHDPSMLYNGMIHSLVGFPIRGAIWYQGESNHGEGMLYLEKKKALIGGWRELWGQGEFPFYYVQIAPFRYGNEDPAILAKFWEAQAAVQAIPHTGMVVINDIATLGDIHPPNKQDVGLRLAQLALKNDYGKTDVVANSPELDSLEVLSDRLKLTFRNTAGGLKTRDGKPATNFEIVGVGSNGFQPATAVIEGDSIVLSSEKVTAPAAFRFAWHMLAEPNLCGGTGLPVGAVRGGEVPDFLSSLPVAKEYTLVYDLDLDHLSHDIHYDTDRSEKIKSFDRIGYLVELTAAGGEEKQVFVSMEAFTKDVRKIGIPTIASNARFQQAIKSMDVFSNVSGITAGTGIATGNIEFWPDNYGVINSTSVAGASDDIYDFGDETAPPADGYGSMQVHNFGNKQTLFSINHWNSGAGADLGIGNGPDRTTDWTFAGNAGSYSSKRLRVYVRETK